MLVDHSKRSKMCFDIIVLHEVVSQHLRPDVCMYVSHLLADNYLSDYLLWSGNVANSDTRSKYLRECSWIHNKTVLVHALDRRDSLTLYSQVAVWVIFKYHNTVLLSKIVDSLSLFKRSCKTSRVLEVRNDVEYLYFACSESLFKLFQINSVFMKRDTLKLNIVRLECIKWAYKAWSFTAKNVAWVAENFTSKLVSLLSTACDDKIISLRVKFTLLFKLFLKKISQRSVSLCKAVLECADRIFLEYLLWYSIKLVHRKCLRRRIACRKWNYLWVRSKFKYLSDSRSLQMRNLFWKLISHNFFTSFS